VEHLILEEEGQLASQETPQVLVDEVVERVPRGVVRELLLKERASRIRLRGAGGGQLPLPVSGLRHRQQPGNGLPVQVGLLGVALAVLEIDI
jgi:hypothetical protein